MTSFRDARRIQPHREVTITRRRVAAVVFLQVAVVGGAFAGGWLLRGEERPSGARAKTTATAFDPLRQLDAEDKRVAYTYHRVLTEPRERPPVATESTEPGAQAAAKPSTAPRVASARAPAPPRTARPARTQLTARAVAQRSRAEEPGDEGGSDESRKLEERVRSLAARSARSARSATPAAAGALRKAAAQAASTDDELHEAMDGTKRQRTRGEE